VINIKKMKVEGMTNPRKRRIFFFIFLALSIIFLATSCNKGDPIASNSADNLEEIPNDSVIQHLSNEVEISKFLDKVQEIDNDSIRNNYLLKLSYRFLKKKPGKQFLNVNSMAFELARKRMDTLSIAASYWDLAEYYHKNRIEDSAYLYYNRAQRLYEIKDKDYSSARLLIQIGNVESNIGNYTGSEISIAKAIYLLKKLNKKGKLYNAYNNLGIVYSELAEYENALDAHFEALDYIDNTANRYSYASSLNNIGVVYFKKEDYKNAIKHYNKALNLDLPLEKEDPKLFAMLIDNLAIAMLSSGNRDEDLINNFKKAQSIRINHKIKDGITMSKIHIAEYYISKGDTSTAMNFLEDARILAQQTNNTRDLLVSLNLLSKLDQNDQARYLRSYISINDSLAKEQRQIRNKFTKLRLETNEYISETKELSKTIVITTASFIILIILIISFYIIRIQKSKNKRLELVKQTALDQNEIQELSLALRDKFEEGAEQEKFRISRELHDGILGRIFGVRLSLDILNDQDSEEAKNRRNEYIKEIQNISEDIRLISHKLGKSKKVTTNFDSVIKELINEKQKLNKNINFELFLDSRIKWGKIDDNIKINLYRIIQESITNIEKHAKAKNTKISLSHDLNYLKLNIEDDGVGFVTKKMKKGIGLKNIQTRTSKINGFLEILSKESGINGTIIKIVIEI